MKCFNAGVNKKLVKIEHSITKSKALVVRKSRQRVDVDRSSGFYHSSKFMEIH